LHRVMRMASCDSRSATCCLTYAVPLNRRDKVKRAIDRRYANRSHPAINYVSFRFSGIARRSEISGSSAGGRWHICCPTLRVNSISQTEWKPTMGSQQTGRVHINRAMLLVCDSAGKVEAMTAADDKLLGASFAHRDFGEIFGRGSTINQWFTERRREARNKDEYVAETRLEDGDGPVLIRLESLNSDHELYGFALRFLPMASDKKPCALHEGDSIVERKQWHEIKNHVGALKLYATFLKRKMPEGDERRIIEKIFNGVNELIGYMDRIRRGGAQ